MKQNNRENPPPCLSNGSVMAAQLTGLGDLVPALISDRGGSRVFRMALMAIGWVSWWPGQLTAPGVTCTGVNGHWKLRPAAQWPGASDGALSCSSFWFGDYFERALEIWAREFSCALRGREANSSFCLNHYRRYLCEIDTIRAEITNRFLKWVLSVLYNANLTIKMFSVYSKVLMIFELLC